MDNSVNDLLILRCLRVGGLRKKDPVLVSVCWLKPPKNWIKINTDGASHGAPGLVGVSSIFWDHRGLAMASFAALIGYAFAFEA